MSDDPNADLFSDSEPVDPEKEHIEHTFGKNPNRTSAISDLFSKEMMESISEDSDLPEEAKPQMIFKMTANSVLDMIMESLDPELREEVCACFDGYLGMCLVNKNFGVDLMGELAKAMSEVKQEENESDEDFDRRLDDMEEYWWSISQPALNARNPSDAIREESRRYGLDRCQPGIPHPLPGSS